jgi:hypothetical protein
MTSNSSHATGPRGSHFADADAARRAIEMALPMIECAMQDSEVCGSGFLYIVVMDPGLTPRDADFADAVLVEHALGDRTQWDADYAGFARAKARLSWLHERGSHEVQASRTQVLRRGDSVLWGSAYLDGIVVGVSGAHPWFDEAFALAIAANLRAISKSRHAQAVAQGYWVAGGPAI